MITDHISLYIFSPWMPSPLERRLDQITERRRYAPEQEKLNDYANEVS